jgi:hypothetical protein
LGYRPVKVPLPREGYKSPQPYSADEIDFLVAYIFPEDIWYVFPVELIENRTVLCIRPGSKRSWLEPYREAWKLMGPAGVEHAAAAVAAT